MLQEMPQVANTWPDSARIRRVRAESRLRGAVCLHTTVAQCLEESSGLLGSTFPGRPDGTLGKSRDTLCTLPPSACPGSPDSQCSAGLTPSRPQISPSAAPRSTPETLDHPQCNIQHPHQLASTTEDRPRRFSGSTQSTEDLPTRRSMPGVAQSALAG